MGAIKSFFENVLWEIPTIGLNDILDILIVAFLFYKVIMLVRSTTTVRIGKAIIAVIVLTWLTQIARLNALNYLLNLILQMGVIALVILFQPELRRFMEKLGGTSLRDLIAGKRVDESELTAVITQTVDACSQMSQKHIGALIVFARSLPLDEYFRSGTVVDAQVTSQLLRSLFFPNSALHDGAVIIRNQRVAAAGCVLPLTENVHISSDLGTRHRAGIGVSEVSDSVVVIVSEESGSISVAVNGMLKRHLAPETLRRLLESELAVNREGAIRRSASLRAKLRKGGGSHDKNA